MVQQEIRDMEEESRKTKSVQMKANKDHGQGGQPLNGHCHGHTSGSMSR